MLRSHQAKTMTTKYQQPVTSTLQLKELRCKRPSLSAASQGHQRPRRSESAAALTVWVSPLSLQRNLFVLRMFTDPRKDKQLLSCLVDSKHGAVREKHSFRMSVFVLSVFSVQFHVSDLNCQPNSVPWNSSPKTDRARIRQRLFHTPDV